MFIGHGTASDLVAKFNEVLKGINLTRSIQFSVDVSSVNWKFYEKVEKSREETDFSKLVDIGSCSLHVVHGELKTGLISCFLQHLNFPSFFVFFAL